ncbi:MAG: hypothetical protein M3040_08150 [Bacteroidota bacterium]|nr:hypothetical protein [Bacteroidota bacterium]
MKKLLLIAIVAFLTTTQLSAQTEKGKVMVGGEVLLLGRSGNTTFTATPNIGYFFMNNVAGGAEFNLITGGGYTNWGIGPYLRAYFGGTPTGKLFAQAGIAFAGSTGSSSSTGFSGRVGYASFLTKNVALEVAARVITGGGTIYGLGAGFQIHL